MTTENVNSLRHRQPPAVKPTMSDTQCGEKALAKYDGSYHKLFSAVSDCIFDLQRSW